MTYSATSTKWFLNNVGYTGNTGFYGNQFSFGQRINYFAARDYLTSNLSTLATGSATTSGNISDSLASDYDVRERITAGYAQLKLKFGALTLIPGVRVENTYDSTKAKIVNAASKITDGFNTFGKVNYTDVFPGLNAKYDVTRDLLLRGAVTTSIGRPNYPQLAPYVTVTDTSQTATAVSIGNPNLKPYRSVNLDASVEFYPAQGSIISAGIFTKSIDNPIYSTTTLQNNVTLGNVLYSAANVTQPFNADHENVTAWSSTCSTSSPSCRAHCRALVSRPTSAMCGAAPMRRQSAAAMCRWPISRRMSARRSFSMRSMALALASPSPTARPISTHWAVRRRPTNTPMPMASSTCMSAIRSSPPSPSLAMR
jgi:TonB-dependent receptor